MDFEKLELSTETLRRPTSPVTEGERMNVFDKLELSTETLRELTPRELSAIAGGAQGPTGPQPTPPIYVFTHGGACPSGTVGVIECVSATCA